MISIAKERIFVQWTKQMKIFYKIFVSIYKREPKDTFWSMDLSLMKDGIFNFLYVISSLCIPLFLEHYFLK